MAGLRPDDVILRAGDRPSWTKPTSNGPCWVTAVGEEIRVLVQRDGKNRDALAEAGRRDG